MIDQQFLQLLSKKYPNRKAATGEIINLRAILALPKGTEYFLSDLHGEHDAFVHMLKSASGVIKSKIDEIFDDEMDAKEREQLASLIYNTEAELKRRKKEEENYDQWCYKTIYRLIQVCKSVSTKYTRSKVRKQLPEYWGYSMDELLHADDEANRAHYYGEIITSIIESGMAEDFMTEMSEAISNLAVDELHIIGDIWDRGAHPDEIMDYLMEYHNVDFQWGNHDIVWMGAATGSWPCITNILRMNISYNNFDMLEIGYGINLRALSSFAQEVYGDDPCEYFKPKILETSKFDPVSESLAAKMHKAIAICQFKVEGQRIMAHPEYGLENRLLLDKIDYDRGTIVIKGKEYELRDKNFPTIDPSAPYELTDGELHLLRALEASVLRSRDLQEHIRFMFSHGALYKVQNNNLFFHGCIPMDEQGDFVDCTVNGNTSKGKAYMDYLDDQIRKSFFNPEDSEEIGHSGDLMWYLWLGSKSPLFGKDQMTTFERLFIADKATHKEHTVPYYKLINERKHCETILREFGIDPKVGHILNGHVPVKIKDGESPVKGGGKLIVIDGGISKAYQKTTGIAGYTFIYNSRFMALAEHKPYQPLKKDGTQVFNAPTIRTVEVLPKRLMVKDTDQAKDLNQQIKELRALVVAYKQGQIKEEY
ncbi:MAG: fructose-1,6-bisphosphatase [Eubacteriaceae bacterium]|nr:fructose-1,6-bisphosphatase [Eubacteriaceae bacterium]